MKNSIFVETKTFVHNESIAVVMVLKEKVIGDVLGNMYYPIIVKYLSIEGEYEKWVKEIHEPLFRMIEKWAEKNPEYIMWSY